MKVTNVIFQLFILLMIPFCGFSQQRSITGTKPFPGSTYTYKATIERNSSRPYVYYKILGGRLESTGKTEGLLSDASMTSFSDPIEFRVKWDKSCIALNNARIWISPSGFGNLNSFSEVLDPRVNDDPSQGPVGWVSESFAMGCAGLMENLIPYLSFSKPTCEEFKSFIASNYGREILNCCDVSNSIPCSRDSCDVAQEEIEKLNNNSTISDKNKFKKFIEIIDANPNCDLEFCDK